MDDWGANDEVVSARASAPVADHGDWGADDEIVQDNPLVRGAKQSARSISMTGDLTTGDYAGVAQTAKEFAEYAQANPGSQAGQELSEAWRRGEGIVGGVSEVGGEIAKDWREAKGFIPKVRSAAENVGAMGAGVVEQIPNMAAPMGGMIAGGVGGAAAGSAVPIIGTTAGAIGGAFLGASAGNTAIEGGYQVMDALNKAGIDPRDTAAVKAFLEEHGDTILGKTAIKGAVLGGVDTATMGLGHLILSAPAKAATGRALAEMGVDVGSRTAVNAAMKTPEFAARYGAAMSERTAAQKLGRNTAAFAMEPAGEFTGEYFGQGLGFDQWDPKNATLEALSSLGQSGLTFAAQKAYQGATAPMRGAPNQVPPASEGPPPGPMSRAAQTAAASGAAAQTQPPTVTPTQEETNAGLPPAPIQAPATQTTDGIQGAAPGAPPTPQADQGTQPQAPGAAPERTGSAEQDIRGAMSALGAGIAQGLRESLWEGYSANTGASRADLYVQVARRIESQRGSPLDRKEFDRFITDFARSDTAKEQESVASKYATQQRRGKGDESMAVDLAAPTVAAADVGQGAPGAVPAAQAGEGPTPATMVDEGRVGIAGTSTAGDRPAALVTAPTEPGGQNMAEPPIGAPVQSGTEGGRPAAQPAEPGGATTGAPDRAVDQETPFASARKRIAAAKRFTKANADRSFEAPSVVNGGRVTVTQSAKQPGKWQATYWDAEGNATYDSQEASFEDAVKYVSRDWKADLDRATFAEAVPNEPVQIPTPGPRVQANPSNVQAEAAPQPRSIRKPKGAPKGTAPEARPTVAVPQPDGVPEGAATQSAGMAADVGREGAAGAAKATAQPTRPTATTTQEVTTDESMQGKGQGPRKGKATAVEPKGKTDLAAAKSRIRDWWKSTPKRDRDPLLKKQIGKAPPTPVRLTNDEIAKIDAAISPAADAEAKARADAGVGASNLTAVETNPEAQKTTDAGQMGIDFDATQTPSIAPENAVGQNQGQKFSRDAMPETDARDAEYMAAVERGDMETAQRMVDDAARTAGYTVEGHHGTRGAWGFTVFDASKEGGVHFGTIAQAKMRAGRGEVRRFWLKAENSARLKDNGQFKRIPKGRDSAVYLNRYEGISTETVERIPGEMLDRMTDAQFRKRVPEASDSVMVRDAWQIKSADPVTYDDSGNIIPLSQRFNKAKEDVRYSNDPIISPYGRSRATEATRGMPQARVQAIADKMVDNLLGETAKRVKVRVVASQSDAWGPGTYDRHGKVRGAWDPEANDVVLVAEHMASPLVVQAVLRHEVQGHVGWQLLKDTDRAEFTRRVLEATTRNPWLRSLRADVERAEGKDASPDLIAEEVFARVAEAGRSNLGTAWDRMLNWIAERLRALGMTFVRADAAYVRTMAADLARAIRAGREPGSVGGGVRYAADQPTRNAGELPETIDIDGVQRSTRNSEGKPIHPTDDGVRNFYRWFKDSKVVDERGRPLVVYHGTSADFSVFTRQTQSRHPSASLGTFFTESPFVADLFNRDMTNAGPFGDAKKQPFAEGAQQYPVYLAIQKPKVLSYEEFTDLQVDNESKPDQEYGFIRTPQAWAKFSEGLRSLGFDGVLISKYPGTVYSGSGLDEYAARQWVSLLKAQVKSAVGNTGAFSPDNADIRYSRTLPSWVTPGVGAEAARKLGVGKSGPTLRERFDKMRDGWQEKAIQGIFDQFRSIQHVGQHPYMLARQSNSVDQTVEATMRYGLPVMDDDGGLDVRIDGKGGALDMFADLNGEHERGLMWMAGNRADRIVKAAKAAKAQANTIKSQIAALRIRKADEIVYASKGPERLKRVQDIDRQMKDLSAKYADAVKRSKVTERNLNQDEIDWAMALNQGTMPDGRDRATVYETFRKRFQQINGAVLDVGEKAGDINPESRKLWEREFYVNFMRDLGEGDSFNPNIGGGLIHGSPIHRMKGGVDATNNLLDNTLNNWSALLSSAARTRAAAQTLQDAEAQGAVLRIPAMIASRLGASAKKSVVSVRINGKEVAFEVPDQSLIDSLHSLEPTGFKGPIMDTLRAFKRILTVGVTSAPSFKFFRNPIRDSATSIATSGLSYNPGSNLYAGLKAQNDPTLNPHLLAGGALFRLGSSWEGTRSDHTRRMLEEMNKDQNTLNTPTKVKNFLKHLWERYQEAGDKLENVQRAALYVKLRAEGKSHLEASYEARDLMDFGLSGAAPAVRFLTTMVPFMNARLQGLYKLGRAGHADPKRMAAVLAATTMAGLALALAYRDDEDWKRRPDWDRENYYWFKIGDVAFRIPRPFEIGALGSVVEDALEYAPFGPWSNDEMTGKRFRDRLTSVISNQLALNPLPTSWQIVKPLAEVAANKSGFTSAPIESMGMERLLPQDRFTSQTSEVAKLASRGLNAAAGVLGAQAFSPVQIDYLVAGYLGWMGTMVLAASNQMARPVLDRPAQPSLPLRWWGGIAEDLRSDPVRSRYVTQFYTQARQLQEAYASWQEAGKRGDRDRQKSIIAQYGPSLPRDARRAARLQRTLSALNKRRRLIERGPQSGSQKARELFKISEQMDRIAEQVGPLL